MSATISVPCRVAPPPPSPSKSEKSLSTPRCSFTDRTLFNRQAQKRVKHSANVIDVTHPLHADFSCDQCYPITSSIREKIIAHRSRKQESGYTFRELLKPSPDNGSPLTEEELMRAYQYELCPHQSIAMARATPNIVYKGETCNAESRMIGMIIRWILSNDICILKSDIAIVPKKFVEVCSSYDLEMLEDGAIVERLYSLRDQNPGRLLLIVPRRMEPHDWACTKSVIVYLACKNWEVFMVQSPPILSSSRLHFNQTDERLSFFSEDLDGIDADIRSRIHIATHANNVYRGFWPISLAAAHNPHVIFQWFGATPKHENNNDSIVLHRSPGV